MRSLREPRYLPPADEPSRHVDFMWQLHFSNDAAGFVTALSLQRLRTVDLSERPPAVFVLASLIVAMLASSAAPTPLQRSGGTDGPAHPGQAV